MESIARTFSTARRSIAASLIVTLLSTAPAAQGYVQRPAATDFGMGPRISAGQIYHVTLRPTQPLRLRELQTVPVMITDANGRPVEGAAIRVDGGMPQHGHGLPTRPRVTHGIGAGVYDIEGVRFGMSGWWELKLAIDSPAGTDKVTFNLSL